MLCTQSALFDIPVGLSTVLQIRETNSYQRMLSFQNHTSSELSIQIEESSDGGATWSVVGTAFVVGALGSASEIVVKSISSTNILRVRCSGGGDDRDLTISYARLYADATNMWSSPQV